jgi:hypothetical protein
LLRGGAGAGEDDEDEYEDIDDDGKGGRSNKKRVRRANQKGLKKKIINDIAKTVDNNT